MKTTKKVQVMKSPDMFRDSVQLFDRKTGQRVSYYDQGIEFKEPEPEKEPVIKEQLTLF